MAFSMAVVSNEVLGEKGFEEVAQDIFQNKATGDLCILEPGSSDVLLVRRSNVVTGRETHIFK